MNNSSELYARALAVIPGGASRDTVLRAPHPIYAARSQGCIVTDVSGRQYIDFVNNMASLVHGHAYPPIVEAVSAQLRIGSGVTFATAAEVIFAEHMCSRTSSFERIRFMNSGTEAVMAMVKAARAYTGRAKIAKVEGAYHGAYDYVETSQNCGPSNWGPPEQPISVPLSAGTPRGVTDDVIVIPFNDSDTSIRILESHGKSVAGILLDLIPHRVGLIPADPDYVKRLSAWAKANGSLLLFDEVITFRTEVGGAQARYDVQPDLTSLGKAIGGGFPVGAVAGRAEVMAVFISEKGYARLPQSGTFSANPITMTAGLVAMQHLGADSISRLNALGELTRASLTEVIRKTGVAFSVTGTGSMFRIHLSRIPPGCYRDTYVDAAGKAALAKLIDGLLDAGIMLANTGTGMLSTVMGESEVEQLACAFDKSVRAISIE